MIKFNGCWEDRDNRLICRWFVAWDEIDGILVGCVGGYSGGGCFQLEKFVNELDKFHIESDADLTHTFSDLIVQSAEDCQDILLSFHDDNAWIDSENLILKHKNIEHFVKRGDMLYWGDNLPIEFNTLFQKIGLTSNFK